jgi:SAM-dependent methyltransferase
MMGLGRFPWPKPPGGTTQPVWNGTEFSYDDRHCRVLAYEESASHWSGDLTSLHEQEAGRDHPIDLASRRLAVGSMLQLKAASPIVLDVGCSSGFVLEDLRQALPRAALIGADYLPGPLDGLGLRMPDIPILQFDLRQCPLPNACVDGITCLNVLEHIDDHAAALAEIHRVLKSGGLAHVEVPAGPELYDIYDEHLMHHRRYRLAELVGLARAQGFEVRRATHLGFFIFPAFRLVKRSNQRLLTESAGNKSRVVAQQIRRTRRSPLLALLMRCETALGHFMAYPRGIRCIVVLQKM